MKAKTKRVGKSIISEYDNSAELVDEYVKATLEPSNRVKFIVAVIAFACAGAAISLRFNYLFSIGMLIAGCLLLSDALWRSNSMARKKTLKGYKERFGGADTHVKVTLDREGIRYEVNGAEVAYAWSDVKRVGQSAHLVVLMCDGGVVPIAKTTSPKQMADLQDMLKEHVPAARGLR